MLDNMSHSRAVFGRRAESNIKNFIVVIIRKQSQPGTGFFVAQKKTIRIQIRHLPGLQYLITPQPFDFLFHLYYLLHPLSLFSIFIFPFFRHPAFTP